MSNLRHNCTALIARILEGDGGASHTQRRAAFENTGLAAPLSTLVEKLAKQAHMITDVDIGAPRSSGLSEDQIFEIVICAAVGQSTRQYDAALAALDAAAAKE